MKYFVRWKEPSTDWQEISRERAIEILECNYNNVDEVLAYARADFPIGCMFCDIKVTN